MEEEEKRRQEEARQRQESTANVPEREPVMVRIGDRDVDISGTEIDRDYIEALPEDMREEVFALYVRERRANASSTDTDVREIDPTFRCLAGQYKNGNSSAGNHGKTICKF